MASVAGQPQNKWTKIFLLDDHPVVRAGLSITLGKIPGFIVCGEAEDVMTALTIIPEHKPNIVIADMDLADSNGLDFIREANKIFPDLPIIMFSMHDEVIYAERAIRAGARGYVMKSDNFQNLVKGVNDVLAGGIAVSENIKSLLVKRIAGGGGIDEGDSMQSLSDRELDVFRQIGMGIGIRKIAEKLCLSVKTVETHVAHIKRKLRLTTTTDVQFRAFHWTQGKS